MNSPKFGIGAMVICLLFLFSFKEEPVDDLTFTKKTSAANYFKNQGLEYKETGKIDSAVLYLKKAHHLYDYSNNYSESVNCLYHLGIIEEQNNNNILALQYFAEANNMLAKHKLSHLLWADILYKMGRQYFVLNNFGQAYPVLNQCLHKSIKVQAADSTLARASRLKGLVEYYKGDYNMAIESLQKSVDLGAKAFGQYSLFVSDQVNNIGVMTFMIGRDDEALSYYQKSESIMKQGKITSSAGLSGTYVNIGLIFKNKNDWDNALLFFNKALEIGMADPQNSTSAIANIYLNMGAVYRAKHNQAGQIETLNKALYFSQKYYPVQLPRVYQMLAVYFTDIKNYGKAEYYYQLALHKAQKLFAESSELAFFYNNYGEFQTERKNYGESFKAFKKSLVLDSKFFGNHHPSTSICFFNLSNYFLDVHEPNNALRYIQMALNANSKNSESPDVFSNIDPDQALSPVLMVELLEQKAQILKTLSEKSKMSVEKTNYLKVAWETYHTTLKIVDKIRTGYNNEESRLLLYENEQNTYDKALACALQLFRETKNPDYLAQAFVIADKTHASSLQSTVKEKELPRDFKLTDTSLIQENSIKKELTFYEELILNEQSARKPDAAKIKFWTSKTANLTFQLEHLLNQLQISKPAWFQYKYRTNDNELIRQVQHNLNINEVIIEYFYTDSTFYSFCLSKQKLRYYKTPMPSDFEKNLNGVLSFVSLPKVYITDSLSYLCYRSAGWELYKLMIKPFENDVMGKKLIVIPFEKLTYIPFETLLTHESLSKPYNFRELPYLIKEHAIRYLYASNLLNIRKVKATNGLMAAFAPIYRTSAKSGYLNSLSGTTDEVKAISSYFPGKVFTANLASEENFKKTVFKYSTLHLAMHANVDDEAPMHSYLAFTPNSSSNEDDLLYTYEIPNLHLNTDLVILSACNTGTGKLRKGEGMLSLTRSFAFAGVPSIVMTLWAVNDNTSSMLMKKFYSRLSTGCTKDDALHYAKLEYLQNSDVIHAHPYYWAGYVLIGDNGPVKSPKHITVFIVLILISMIIVAFIWIRWRSPVKVGEKGN